MKKNIFIVIVFLFTMYPIFCVEIPDSVKAKAYDVTLSLGNTTGGSIGIGKIQYSKKSTKEITANFHYLMNSDYFVTGIYGQINLYRNVRRVGFFTLIKAGVDYAKGREYQNPIFGIPGGPNEGDYDKKKFEGTFPNLVIGCGFSTKLSSNSRLLIYIDLGIKKDFASLNVGTTF